MSKYSFLLILVILSFIACNQNRIGLLPNSVGKIDEVLVIMDDHNWNGVLGDAIMRNFAAPYLVLPQAEPILSIRHKNRKQFNHLLQRYRNIVMVAPLDEQNEITDLLKETLGKEYLENTKKDSSIFYLAKQEVWANPQLVVLVFAPTQQELIDKLATHADELIGLIQLADNKIIEKKLFSLGKNDEAMKTIREKFNIDLPVPRDYALAIEKEDFMWLRKETADLSSSIMIYVQPDNDSTDLKERWSLRNVAGKKYISGGNEGSYMTTDTLIPLVQKERSLNNHQAIESRGLWRLEKDFMGGPFINYVIRDEQNKCCIVLDGFVYAPKLKKRQYIRELEVLFSLFSFPKES